MLGLLAVGTVFMACNDHTLPASWDEGREFKYGEMTDKGGNTDRYKDGGRKIMAEALRDKFPTVVSITKSISKKYDLQHKINWAFFDVKLRKKYGKNN